MVKGNTAERYRGSTVAPLADGEGWDFIRAEARQLAASEPVMEPTLRLITQARTNAELLGGILASRLALARIDEQSLATLLAGLFDADSDILVAAEADLRAVLARDPACPGLMHVLVNLKGFQALQTYRAAHRLWLDGRTEVANWLSNLASLLFGPDIHPAARIGRAVMLDHGSGIVIGETTVIEDQVSILQNVTLGGTGKETGDRHPKIRRGVMIGAGAKILGNIEVGAYSKVAAGSVVLKPVPPRTTVAGVPATVVRIHRVDEIPAAEMDQTIV
ncbi:serine O-acetyltransferase [Sinorhizobium fredii USDA 205]|uniref:Serine acetyltransferase n=2 Tax=Rhizobium fredii TaxID=380 RepID=A0A2A6LZH2_RHIFR|nr:serine O-acetyltransferase [Sinorhizobium fredii]ASY70498.1 Serine acetyltransferase [Sinorhizobium fredii CCBAU 83666]AWM26583.1 Serine acetyltransferase [Sinorhizobium fredii CCBAU 25509]KSV90586.1 serine O-acetyltransferase [Sinorhizobium fredii USDA 205]MCG5476487.1 serine O-acetyltransferase [Sinorhizobium fredii]MQW96878.1 serine O-acetyltransferase [Sinorhizobium fredii]